MMDWVWVAKGVGAGVAFMSSVWVVWSVFWVILLDLYDEIGGG